MRYTIGNNQPGPTSPNHASQLFAQNSTNLGKFTAHGAVGDTSTGPLTWDIGFAKTYIVRQTQKGGGAGGVKHGFVDASGNKIGTWGHDQDAPAQISKAVFDQHNGNVSWRADYLKAGDYTFQGGAG